MPLYIGEIRKISGSKITFEDPIEMVNNTDAFSGAITTTAIPTEDEDLMTHKYYKYALYHNYIMNGDMSIAQRGTSFTAVATGAYTLDRWKYYVSGAAVHTITQDSDVPTTSNTKYSLKLDCTTADASIASGDYCFIAQLIEGYVFRPLVGKEATLSFWVKAKKTGWYNVSFGDSVDSTNYIRDYYIRDENTWEYKTITLTFNYAGGTWDYTTGIGLYVRFVLSCGDGYTGSESTWSAGASKYAVSSQVNGTDSTDNNFWITEVMLNEGSGPASFQLNGINFAGELRKCQRYYEKSFDYAVAPADDAGAQEDGCQVKKTTMTDTYWPMGMVQYEVRKRTRVSPTLYNPSAVDASNKIRNFTDNANLPAAIQMYSETNHWAYVNNSSIATGKTLIYHWVVDAEL